MIIMIIIIIISSNYDVLIRRESRSADREQRGRTFSSTVSARIQETTKALQVVIVMIKSKLDNKTWNKHYHDNNNENHPNKNHPALTTKLMKMNYLDRTIPSVFADSELEPRVEVVDDVVRVRSQSAAS